MTDSDPPIPVVQQGAAGLALERIAALEKRVAELERIVSIVEDFVHDHDHDSRDGMLFIGTEE